MPKYRTNWHLALDGRMFEPGDEVELTETKAATLGAVVSPVESASEPAAEAPSEAKPVRKGKGKGGAE
jgi:hypothetical protein